MYGAIPLSYKGMTTKIHLIPISMHEQSTKALLFTRLFTVRGLDEAQWTAGTSLSSSWGSNASSSSTVGPLNQGYPFPKMTPITKDPKDRNASPTRRHRRSRSPSTSFEPPVTSQRPQTTGDRFTAGWFPSPSPILTRGPILRRTPSKTPSPEHNRRRTRGTTMFAIGVIIPVSSTADVAGLLQDESYSTLRRSLEELVRDIYEKLESGEYQIDFSEDVNRFLTRLKYGLGVLKKVPFPWKGTEEVWRDLILSLSAELDSRYATSCSFANFSFLKIVMSNVLMDLSERHNTPPPSPLHHLSSPDPPPTRLLILSTSPALSNRFTSMLLPLYDAVYPSHRQRKKTLPKPPKIQILPTLSPRESLNSSYSSNASIPPSRTIDLPRRATHPFPAPYQRQESTLKSPPTLSVFQTPGGGNPSSVSSWFGSWIRQGGPLAVSNQSSSNLSGTGSPFSPRTKDFKIHDRAESDGDLSSPEVDVVKDAAGEVVDVKLSTSFQNGVRGVSGENITDQHDIVRRGSMSLNNVMYIEDAFRVTGYHAGGYHVDYHLQSMERTDDLGESVFRVLKEDILFFYTPPVHAVPLHPPQMQEMPRFGPGQRKVSCIIADIDSGIVERLSVKVDDDVEIEGQETEILGLKNDSLWRQLQDWALDGVKGMDQIIDEILA